MLLGPRSAGFGLNLTSANHVVHLNRWWNPAVEDQCSDRIYRIGQDKAVTIHLPLAIHPRLVKDSFDLILDGLLERKRGLSRDIVVPTAMSDEEAHDLFARVTGADLNQPGKALVDLDDMGWERFQLWVADQFKAAGYQAYGTPRSADGGADVVLRHPSGGRSIICQCKHRSRGGSVDRAAINDTLRARTSYSQTYPWLGDPLLFAVTNGQFDGVAARMAEQHRVVTVDRENILRLKMIAGEHVGA